jgi:uncharacterized membrane protein YjjP (DUF1212 family)
MSEPTLSDILVAIARFETKQDAMMEKLEKLEKTSDNHWKKISEIEAELAVLKSQASRDPEKSKPWGVILAVGVSVATFLIMILDRFYVNQ